MRGPRNGKPLKISGKYSPVEEKNSLLKTEEKGRGREGTDAPLTCLQQDSTKDVDCKA